MDIQTNRWIDIRTDKQIERWMYVQTYKRMDIQRDRRGNRLANWQIDDQVGRQTDRQIDESKDRQTEKDFLIFLFQCRFQWNNVCFTFSCFEEGASKKLLQFLMPLEPICNKNFCVNEQNCLL